MKLINKLTGVTHNSLQLINPWPSNSRSNWDLEMLKIQQKCRSFACAHGFNATLFLDLSCNYDWLKKIAWQISNTVQKYSVTFYTIFKAWYDHPRPLLPTTPQPRPPPLIYTLFYMLSLIKHIDYKI